MEKLHKYLILCFSFQLQKLGKSTRTCSSKDFFVMPVCKILKGGVAKLLKSGRTVMPFFLMWYKECNKNAKNF